MSEIEKTLGSEPPSGEWEHFEKVYQDPSAAHEWAIRVEMKPDATKPMISHDRRGFVVKWMERKGES